MRAFMKVIVAYHSDKMEILGKEDHCERVIPEEVI
jgi:hypothetical protein